MQLKPWIFSIVVLLCGFVSSFVQTTTINFEQFSGPSVPSVAVVEEMSQGITEAVTTD